MVTKYGTIIFHEYKKLEKLHGPDGASAYALEVCNRLEKRGLIGPDVPYETEYVKKEAWKEYDILKAEWADDINHIVSNMEL